MAAFHFPLTCLLLFGLQGCGVPGRSHVRMVLPGLLAGFFLAGQLLAAEMEGLGAAGVTMWLYVRAVLGFPFCFYGALLQCSL